MANDRLLWAPWRMAYIRRAETAPSRADAARRRGSTGGPGNGPRGCLFCRVRSPGDDRRNLVVARRPHAFLMLNRFPYNPAHVMVAVARHAGHFADLTRDEREDVMALVALAERAIAVEYRPHGMNAGANLGRVAGAGVLGHLHLHLVPRWNGDTNFMPTIGGTKVLPESLGRTWSRLRAAVHALDAPVARRSPATQLGSAARRSTSRASSVARRARSPRRS